MSDTVEVVGNVVNPYTTALPDNSFNPIIQGRNTETLISECHGKWFNAAARGVLFTFNVTGKTIPVTVSAGQLTAAPFCLYNPVGSNRLAELIDLEIGDVLVTTVVDTVGLYTLPFATAQAGTFTTAGTPICGLLNGPVGVVTPYTAYTSVASCTPSRWQMVGTFGAAATLSNQLSRYVFDGRAILTPGQLIIACMSTTVGTTSGLDMSISWIETPIVM